MTPEQLHQIEQARRYAEQDEYVVTRTHIRNLLAIIEQRAASAPDGWKLVPIKPTKEMFAAGERERMSHPSNVNPWHTWHAMLSAAPEAPKS